MSKPSKGQSVFDEPHLSKSEFLLDNSEKIVTRKNASKRAQSIDQRVEHTVWDEPALSNELVHDIPENALTYRRWYEEGIHKITLAKSWIITFCLAIASGPWAVVGAFFLAFQGMSGFGGGAVVIFAPLTEEVLKVASALMIIEKRPFFFKSARQIFICCFFSGVVFSFIENLLYLNIYIQNPPPMLVLWRWSVCVLLHTSCSSIVSAGLIEMWKDSMKERAKARIILMFPALFIAVTIHASYNVIALLIDPLISR